MSGHGVDFGDVSDLELTWEQLVVSLFISKLIIISFKYSRSWSSARLYLAVRSIIVKSGTANMSSPSIKCALP